MIASSKWDKMTDEQKLMLCESVKKGADVNSITKQDWKLMFDFLLNKVQGGSR